MAPAASPILPARPPSAHGTSGRPPGDPPPAAGSAAPPAESAPQQATNAKTGTRPQRVLIADDNQGLRTLLNALLSLEEDFEVVAEAEDGKAALELSRRLDPDLVLLDLAMPKLDGLEVLEQLDVRAGRPRVLVYTGFASPEVAQAARELGAVDVVVKDADPAVLIKRLREAGA